jgi:hypothetical protein
MACSELTPVYARVQSVPHRKRSKPLPTEAARQVPLAIGRKRPIFQTNYGSAVSSLFFNAAAAAAWFFLPDLPCVLSLDLAMEVTVKVRVNLALGPFYLLPIICDMCRAWDDKFDPDGPRLGRRLRGSRAKRRVDSAQSRMQVGSSGHRHRITALMIGGRIAQHRQHVVERQDTRRRGGDAGLLGHAIARSLLSSTGFATACLGNPTIYFRRPAATALAFHQSSAHARCFLV